MRPFITITIFVLMLVGGAASAQERAVSPTDASKNNRLFGAEFEFAGRGNRAAMWENQSYENYRKVMEVIAKHFGGRAADVKKIVWKVPHPSGNGERTLYRAEYTDPRGRTWKVEPEYVDTRSLDGYELVTPPLEDPRESMRVLEKLKSSGLLREGVKSGAHIHIDGRDLITPRGNATALINTITMHETYEPLLRSLFNPVRGSGLFNHNRSDAVTNRFARSFALDHPGLLEAISKLPPEKRTQAEIERLFSRATAAEMKAHNINELNTKSWKTMWKYRSLNLINVLNINEALPASKGTVEFRMNDLPLSDPKLHLLEVKLYQALVERAKSLAEAGKVFEFKAPTQAPRAGEDPVRSRAPRNPTEARNQINEMIEFLNLNPAEYKYLVDRNLQRSRLPAEEVLEKRLASRNTPTINGSKVSYELSVDGQKTRFTSLEAAQEALNRISADPSAKNKDIRLTLEAKPGRAYMTKHAAELAEFVSRADAFSRLNAIERGAPTRTGYSNAEVANLEKRLRTGSQQGNTGSGRSVNLLSSQGDTLRLEIVGKGSQASSINQVNTLLGEQLKRGAFGPWTGERAGNEAKNANKAGNAVDFVKNAERYLSTIEGKALEAHQRSFLEGLQRRGKIASTLSLPLLDFHESKHLPKRVTRDLGFRQQEYIRNLLALADAVQQGKYGEANNLNRGAIDRDARAIVQRWAKETKLARYTLRSLVGEAKDARKAATTPAKISRAEIYKSFSSVKQPNGESFKLEVVDSRERFIKPGEGKTLRLSTALINEVHSKSMVLEPGIRGEYRRKALSALFEAEIKRASIPRTPTGEVDRLAKYRRADGTLRWKAITADKALQHGAGVAHFALALFLKEMAVVVKTGDKARIEEFFEGLATTDFFVVYGLFSAGAHVGNVAYSKYLEKYVKPKFVSGILRTNLVLATGMALPEIYHGTFNGKAFAINLAGLGLSTTAVKAGVASLKWVTNLGKADRTGRMAAKLAKFRSFAKVGGWFYTAAETAVVLYFGEEISAAVNKYLDDKAARNSVADASVEFFKAVSDKGLTDEKFAEALDKFNGAHVDYRNYLYKPLAMEEEVYFARLTKAARKAKILEDKRRTRLEKLERFPALKATVIRKYGSLEKYAEHLAKEDEKEVDEQVATYLESYNLNREAHLKEVYTGNKRGGSYLNSEHALWVANGAKPGAAGDPFRGRSDYFARSGREGVVEDFRDAAYNISKNRIEAYSDQEAALRLALKTTDDPDKKKLITELISALNGIREKDEKLGSVTSDGAVGALRGQ